MSVIHDSTKALVEEAFYHFEEAIQNGIEHKVDSLRKCLLEVFNNTIDDNAKLLDKVNKERSN